MATPSDAPPSSADEKPQNTGPTVSQAIQPPNAGHQNTNIEAVKESSPTSVFVNSEPIREDQVQNAMKFLSHPKVRGSPVMYRRSFLERKGLTKEEIDEAFRCVPDPSPAVTSTQTAVSNQDGQVKSSSNVQQQPPTQVQQPLAVASMGSTSKLGLLSQFHWYHAILAVGVLAVSGAGTAVLFKKSIVPRLKSWIRKIVLEEVDDGQMKKINAKPSPAEEAAVAAKAAASAAADVARVSQEMLITKSEEKRCFEELINMLNIQVREMKSMSNTIQKLEVGQSTYGRIALEEQDNYMVPRTSSKQPYYANGKTDTDSRSVRSLSPPAPAPAPVSASASVEPSAAPHPKSYMDIMAMIQRGEKPSNIREINDAPPNPNQPVSNPRVAPRPKPWEIQTQNTVANNVLTQESDTSNYDNQLNGDDTAPWWQRKNVRISEIETADQEQKFGSPNVLANERPPQRSWVPPQPPPVAMPEAAKAIRQPKKPTYQTDQVTDAQLLARSADPVDELQRVTKIAETGGSLEANGESSGLPSTEIQTEENGSYLEA